MEFHAEGRNSKEAFPKPIDSRTFVFPQEERLRAARAPSSTPETKRVTV